MVNDRKMHDKLKVIVMTVLPFLQIKEGAENGIDRQVRLYGVVYSVVRWEDEKYERALSEVIRLYMKNGPQYVEICFCDALARILIEPRELDEAIADMNARLAGSIRRRFVCIPVHGVDLRSRDVDFGFGKLIRRGSGMLPEIIKDSESLHSFQHRIDAMGECLCYFEIKTETDHKHSVESAISLCGHLMSLLSLYIGSSRYRAGHKFHPWHRKMEGGEVERKRKIAIYGSESGRSQVYYEYYENDCRFRSSRYAIDFNLLVGGHDSNEAINEALEILRPKEAKASYHLLDDNVISEMLSKDNEMLLTCVRRLGKLEEKVFDAVNWFGKAVNCDSSEDQFLFFAIAIECLLVGDEVRSEFSSQGSIGQKMSERSAYLISETYEGRRQTENEVKDLYRIRSKIVHAGRRAANDEVLRIERLARKLIFEFVKRKFESQEGFLQWIKHCQYGKA